ncbi:MAG: hypothetical protein IJE10_11345 [Clostridia bacterium]|nr:hypothetical protein [Clostridia bacterium]
MKDNEIIKALECCGNIVDSTCKECGYHKTYNASCVVRLMRDALDLINRQKAKIKEKDEMLKAQASKIFLYEDVLKEKTAEIERLKSYSNYKVWTVRDKALVLTETLEDYEEFKRNIESEARKEFAERLKAISHPYGDTQKVFELQIDNLLKEMDK